VSLRVVPGPASGTLADAIAALLGVTPVPTVIERFPDGELRPAVDDVGGDDVYVVQATAPPVNEHLVELLLLLDATRRAHAGRVTAVIPYFGYARQDRRSGPGQAVAARVVADAIATAGAHRVVLVDPHTTALEAMFPVPVETLTAVPALAKALAAVAPADAVLVTPDLGGVKLAEAYAQVLDRPVAVVRKTRISGTTVHATELVGEVADRTAIIVDDMISTGATIEAAARLLSAHHAQPDLTAAATHGVFAGDAPERLGKLPLRTLLVTDSVTPTGGAAPPEPTTPTRQTCTIAPLLAETITRLHTCHPRRAAQTAQLSLLADRAAAEAGATRVRTRER
jgi:ribose-phosphate pyrophosphokinase